MYDSVSGCRMTGEIKGLALKRERKRQERERGKEREMVEE